MLLVVLHWIICFLFNNYGFKHSDFSQHKYFQKSYLHNAAMVSLNFTPTEWCTLTWLFCKYIHFLVISKDIEFNLCINIIDLCILLFFKKVILALMIIRSIYPIQWVFFLIWYFWYWFMDCSYQWVCVIQSWFELVTAGEFLLNGILIVKSYLVFKNYSLAHLKYFKKSYLHNAAMVSLNFTTTVLCTMTWLFDRYIHFLVISKEIDLIFALIL